MRTAARAGPSLELEKGDLMPSERYVPIPGSERQPLPGATATGPCDPATPIQVTVVLRPRPSAKRRESLARLIARGHRLTRDEYAARYGADPQDVKRVRAFARRQGLKVSAVNLAARTVTLTGTAGAFCGAFRVDLANYRHSGGVYRGRTGPVYLPAAMKGVIVGVLGLDNRPQAKAHYRVRRNVSPSATPGSVSYTPPQVAALYDFPPAVNGQGQTIGIIELGGGYTTSDLDSYFGGLGISPVPKVTAVSVDGGSNQPTGDPNGPDAEVMLDIEVAGAVAPGANLAVYFAPNTDAGFLDAVNRAVTDKQNNPSVISISWGGPESSWTGQALRSLNTALQSAAAMGVSVCVACGDNGSTDGVTDGQAHVDFPASSPYALACGGTHLVGAGSSITDEEVWNDLPDNGATGGGVSAIFPLPSWQSTAHVPPSVNPGNFPGRGVPDVAGDADPFTGYQVEVDGSKSVVGGTSAVAPLWAGLLARCNQAAAQVGYFNPSLYQKVASASGTFHDITLGNNGAYVAGPGWDACTGWGSPNGAGILAALGKSAPPPSRGKRKHPKKPKRRGRTQ
jgi:kumamolisin